MAGVVAAQVSIIIPFLTIGLVGESIFHLFFITSGCCCCYGSLRKACRGSGGKDVEPFFQSIDYGSRSKRVHFFFTLGKARGYEKQSIGKILLDSRGK